MLDVVCTAGAADRPFEEEHRNFCVAVVTNGTFRYRARQGTAMLTPGALLLGNPGTCYECGHEHGAGDRCLSFQFEPAYMEQIVADMPGVKKLAFETPRLPPLPALAPLLAEAEAAREMADVDAFEEIGLRIAGAAVASGVTPAARVPSRRDQKRVAEAVRRIEKDAERRVSLAELASETATSPYHFLRQLPARGGHDALPVPAENPAAQGGGAAAHVGRGDLDDRLRGGVQRFVDVQPPFPARDGGCARCLSRSATERKIARHLYRSEFVRQYPPDAVLH